MQPTVKPKENDMKKIKTKTRSKAEISTASLPDIVFLLLFFFMVTATIRTVDDQVEVTQPQAEAISKVDQKTLIRELAVGPPKDALVGSEARIYSEGKWIKMEDIAQWVMEQKQTLPESQRDQMIVMLRADEYVKMGMVADIQTELRKADARKILYRTRQQGGQ
ncbi:ExbD/TolR family protein [Reichenbachiella ulvae]|uniref:Biopolymer transporter ExbD n=1 Tax=Reichenbachiella ulvae TaxID=2980104 RepID=A0ABT3CQF9_9BACT|nr:biopolymer transporter ExbD [Reichenbachiella ulvae]MCV9385498.1 biopolymer transporter ExbD [Reichenbachiella ulvae]